MFTVTLVYQCFFIFCIHVFNIFSNDVYTETEAPVFELIRLPPMVYY